jgi:hypothetical protein
LETLSTNIHLGPKFRAGAGEEGKGRGGRGAKGFYIKRERIRDERSKVCFSFFFIIINERLNPTK